MWTLWLLACGSSAGPTPDPDAPPATRIELDTLGAAGLSGLAARGNGALVAVTERPPQLVPITVGGGRITVKPAVPITGLPDGVEPESVAVTPSGAIWVGTEARGTRDTDRVVRLDASHAVAETVQVPWGQWPITVEGNQGVEGLCAGDDWLLIAGESRATFDGKQHAPLGLYKGATWTTLWVELASSTGKLSDLDCAVSSDAIAVKAIERHYEVLSLLTFAVPFATPAHTKLKAASQPFPRNVWEARTNWEGLATLDGALWMLSDNQGSTVTGPTVAVQLKDWPR